MIDAAERARAADPKFLESLRQALKDYQGPQFVELMKDDFRDGNFTGNPRWDEFKGEFTVGGKIDLYSIVQKAKPSEQALLSERLVGGDQGR